MLSSKLFRTLCNTISCLVQQSVNMTRDCFAVDSYMTVYSVDPEQTTDNWRIPMMTPSRLLSCNTDPSSWESTQSIGEATVEVRVRVEVLYDNRNMHIMQHSEARVCSTPEFSTEALGSGGCISLYFHTSFEIGSLQIEPYHHTIPIPESTKHSARPQN